MYDHPHTDDTDEGVCSVCGGSATDLLEEPTTTFQPECLICSTALDATLGDDLEGNRCVDCPVEL